MRWDHDFDWLEWATYLVAGGWLLSFAATVIYLVYCVAVAVIGGLS